MGGPQGFYNAGGRAPKAVSGAPATAEVGHCLDTQSWLKMALSKTWYQTMRRSWPYNALADHFAHS